MHSNSVLGLLVVLAAVPLAWAQFGFFEQMFGNQGQQQQQRRPPSQGSQWAAHADAVSCAQYLCPDTLVCVASPAQCPCPNAEDVRCVIPDAEDKDSAAVLCVRGANDCREVERLAQRFSK